MSHGSTRYFKNPYNNDGAAEVSQELFKARTLTCVDHILKNLPPTHENCDGGLYVGISGVAYTLYYLVKCGLFPGHNERFLTAAKNYIVVALDYCRRRNKRPQDQVSFLLENGGVYVIACLIFHKLQDYQKRDQYLDEYRHLAAYCEPLSFLDNGSDEIFVGRAGYLFGVLLLQRDLSIEILAEEKVNLLCLTTLESGRKFRSKLKFDGSIPLMYAYHGALYLGSAHGIAGILQAILSFPKFLNADANSAKAVKSSVDYLLDRCFRNGNVASDLDAALNPGRERMLVHWCHGAAGVIYTFARAYLVFGKDERYLNACRELAETVWQKGLLRKGPGICHGVAGSGYVFLLMYRLTGEQKYLYQAERFGGFMFTEKFSEGARTPDSPLSLFEGLAGTACFLNDLMQPTKAEFPLLDVFVD
ncbi:unnamed protein product [Clavelina lepadiformis]|uniref:LanC-like protein 3 n=1 Tax=Clavelina lepadiformis TaxID=159417 RepID=A0ABP0F7Z9_CLALP